MDFEITAESLYDFFTVEQLKHIAKHNGVDVPSSARKLKMAQIMYAAKGKDLIIPDDTPARKNINECLVVSMSGKAREERLKMQAKMIDQQRANTLPKEVLETMKPKFRTRSKPAVDKVAVYSEKNLYWSEVGTLPRGFSFLTREEAEKWLTNRSVREASPDEIAAHYGL